MMMMVIILMMKMIIMMMMMMIKMRLLTMVNLAKLSLHGHHAFLCLCGIDWTFSLNIIVPISFLAGS